MTEVSETDPVLARQNARKAILSQILSPSKFAFLVLLNSCFALSGYWMTTTLGNESAFGYVLVGFFIGAAFYSIFLHVLWQTLAFLMGVLREAKKRQEVTADGQ
jgi:hypothetical protein